MMRESGLVQWFTWSLALHLHQNTKSLRELWILLVLGGGRGTSAFRFHPQLKFEVTENECMPHLASQQRTHKSVYSRSVAQCGQVSQTLFSESAASVANVIHGSSSRNNYHFPFSSLTVCLSRSQWSSGLRHELLSPAPTLRSWVRIPLRHGCLCVFFLFLHSLKWDSQPT
jgi:hypothetical protein